MVNLYHTPIYLSATLRSPRVCPRYTDCYCTLWCLFHSVLHVHRRINSADIPSHLSNRESDQVGNHHSWKTRGFNIQGLSKLAS